MGEDMKWLGTPPEISEDALDHTETADVVVAGAGVAGVAAVRAAVEAAQGCGLPVLCSGGGGGGGLRAAV